MHRIQQSLDLLLVPPFHRIDPDKWNSYTSELPFTGTIAPVIQRDASVTTAT